jgi:hypothetical protein
MRKRLKATVRKVGQIRANARERRIAFRSHYDRVFRELSELVRRTLNRRRHGDH